MDIKSKKPLVVDLQMCRPLEDFRRDCLACMAQEQHKESPDKTLVALLSEAVSLAHDHGRMLASAVLLEMIDNGQIRLDRKR